MHMKKYQHLFDNQGPSLERIGFHIAALGDWITACQGYFRELEIIYLFDVPGSTNSKRLDAKHLSNHLPICWSISLHMENAKVISFVSSSSDIHSIPLGDIHAPTTDDHLLVV